MKLALLFGISDYEVDHHNLSDAPLNDVLHMANLLIDYDYEVKMYFDQNVASIIQSYNLMHVVKRYQHITKMVIYYAGHGTQKSITLHNVQILHDAIVSHLNDIQDDIPIVVILDACYSGALIEYDLDKNITVLASSNKNEVSYEKGFYKWRIGNKRFKQNRGVFSFYLERYLKHNNNLVKAIEYVNKKMKNQTAVSIINEEQI